MPEAPSRRPREARVVRRAGSEHLGLVDLPVAAPAPAGPDPSMVEQVRSRAPASLNATSPTPTYVGIAVIAAGFLLLGLAWGGVAGKANVAEQVPYLVSGGLTGIALVIVGVTIVNVAAKRRDSALRDQQIQILAEAMRDLSGDSSPRL